MRRLCVKLFTSLFLAALVGVTLIPAAPAAAQAAAQPTVELKVMTFNIFYGGDEWDLETRHWCYRPAGCPETLNQVVATIRASGADLVGMQEGTANGCRIAARLDWYCFPRMQMLSRYPFVDPPGADGQYGFIEVTPGHVVAMANVHLPSDPYGPYWVRDGEPKSAVLELERTVRLPAIQPQLERLPSLVDAGIPVFLTGDFNSPSHLDWTTDVAAVRDVVRYPVEWPVAKALADAGLRDSYREVYPDPVADPGFTWTPPGTLESVPDEVFDRIDWVLTDGATTTLDSQILGEPGNPDVDIVIDPYPSDHRGVVSTFSVEPAAMPTLVAVGERRVFAGDELAVRWHGSGSSVKVVPAGGGVADAIASRSTGAATDGTATFDTSGWEPGDYEAVLVSGGSVVSRNPFWLYEPGTSPSVRTTRATYAVGEPIRVRWAAAPGWRWDWLGVYRAGNGPRKDDCDGGYCGNLAYQLYTYTNATVEGTTRFDAYASIGYTSWPLGPGRYRIRLLKDDGYQLLASSARFRILNTT